MSCEFGTLAALISDVILTFIFVAFSLAAAVFMLAFLNATVRELRKTGAPVIERRSNTGINLAKVERFHRRDRAA